MTRSAIATQRKKPQTPGQRLAVLDPDLAKLFDQWEADLDQRFDEIEFATAAQADREAVNGVHPGDPTIIDAEEELAFELGRFHLAADPFLEIADGVREARDAAYAVLGRVEHLIAQRTLEALRITPQAALPAPPTTYLGGGNGGDGDGDPKLDDVGDPTEDYRFLRGDRTDPEGLPVGDDGLPEGTPPWDDPEGGPYTIRFSRPRSKWGTPGYARRWIAGAAAWCALPLIAAAAIVARWGW